MLLDRTDDEDGMTLPSPTTRKYGVLIGEVITFNRAMSRLARL